MWRSQARMPAAARMGSEGHTALGPQLHLARGLPCMQAGMLKVWKGFQLPEGEGEDSCGKVMLGLQTHDITSLDLGAADDARRLRHVHRQQQRVRRAAAGVPGKCAPCRCAGALSVAIQPVPGLLDGVAYLQCDDATVII